ncbi:hypothetical protein [Salisediminibacterium selenitireducens]|uniref:Uncharacterized protein n=1 Tax=Bacillus selenitireducens (strain ATCC 700615 / DSM 15326 / MLS10) TaxID=439292 RepID=D6XU36_BACIE|nr:hypothetical protein [Salisediminibacterium selenitireducens]ADH99322.1 hypothetical protein Bsel_1815 [[Bacillus] selenitireducens MLS10]
MEEVMNQFASLQLLNQFWISLFLIIPMVLISRTVVAGTRYSPILIIVIFGLSMGFILVETGVSEPGLPDFPMINLIAATTIIALVVTFFVGGQELRKIFSNKELKMDEMVTPSMEEAVLGTNRTQLVMIIRSFFLLIGLEGLFRVLVGSGLSSLSDVYALIAYIGLVGAVIFIDNKATITNKSLYIRKGLIEMVMIVVVLFIAFHVAMWIEPTVALPQIFFAMLISAAIGAIFYNWSYGPTIKALLFAGIPVVLAGNFMVGGSRISDAFEIDGMNAVLAYGFFGQLFWMFGGIALLIFFAKTNHVRNLAPGMAGALSHSGLTGACTAGDLGNQAAKRAPIMINIPFFGHVFVFSVLAISAEQGSLMLLPAALIVITGVGLTILALRNLGKAKGQDNVEVKALMQFSFGWQLVAVFGGLVLLSMSAMPFDYGGMAQASAISHFGLFAAIQEGMLGAEAAALIPFIFSMPFLVHPVVFFMFGKAMKNDGLMPIRTVYTLAAIGIIGVLTAVFIF